jgi:hypothetical protein
VYTLNAELSTPEAAYTVYNLNAELSTPAASSYASTRQHALRQCTRRQYIPPLVAFWRPQRLIESVCYRRTFVIFYFAYIFGIYSTQCSTTPVHASARGCTASSLTEVCTGVYVVVVL